MRASEKVVFTANEQGVLALMVHGYGSIQILGASVGKYVPANPAEQVYIGMTKGETGFLALMVSGCPGRCDLLVPVSWKEDSNKPVVDLENIWMPPSTDRLPALTSDFLRVWAGEKIFSTISSGKTLEHGIRYVADPNLLCRFLDYKATLEELEAAAKVVADEMSLQAQVTTLRFERDQAIGKLSEAQEESRQLREDLQAALAAST